MTEEPYFRADHPFLFVIRDVPMGAILFMGRVMEPEWSGNTGKVKKLRPGAGLGLESRSEGLLDRLMSALGLK